MEAMEVEEMEVDAMEVEAMEDGCDGGGYAWTCRRCEVGMRWRWRKMKVDTVEV